MTYNKSEIMKRAWNQYRLRNTHFWLKEEQKTFGNYLKDAWKHAKQEAAKEAERKEGARVLAEQLAVKEAAKARAAAALSDTDRARLEALKYELFTLGCKDLWDDSDRAYSRKLEAQIVELETEKVSATAAKAA